MAENREIADWANTPGSPIGAEYTMPEIPDLRAGNNQLNRWLVPCLSQTYSNPTVELPSTEDTVGYLPCV